MHNYVVSVLIESDWNLKKMLEIFQELGCCGINRIRLEFKAATPSKNARLGKGINRIRLEFKGGIKFHYEATWLEY